MMGFRQAASSELVAVEHRPVLRPELEQLLAPVRACWRAAAAGVTAAGHVELVLADNGPLLVLRHLDAR